MFENDVAEWDTAETLAATARAQADEHELVDPIALLNEVHRRLYVGVALGRIGVGARGFGAVPHAARVEPERRVPERG